MGSVGRCLDGTGEGERVKAKRAVDGQIAGRNGRSFVLMFLNAWVCGICMLRYNYNAVIRISHTFFLISSFFLPCGCNSGLLKAF